VKVGKGDAVDLQRDVLCSFDVPWPGAGMTVKPGTDENH